MKNTGKAQQNCHHANRRPCRYPNGVNRRDSLERLVDGALTIATSLGFVSIFYFLITMA